MSKQEPWDASEPVMSELTARMTLEPITTIEQRDAALLVLDDLLDRSDLWPVEDDYLHQLADNVEAFEKSLTTSQWKLYAPIIELNEETVKPVKKNK